MANVRRAAATASLAVAAVLTAGSAAGDEAPMVNLYVDDHSGFARDAVTRAWHEAVRVYAAAGVRARAEGR